MRFRAQLRQIRLLLQAFIAVHRVSKGEVVWKIGERKLLVVSGGSSAGSVQAVCTLSTAQVMESLRLESKQNNQIFLKLDVSSLLRVLKPAERARDTLIKLGISRETKSPVLQFALTMRAGGTADICQEVPVSVLSEEEVADLAVPDCTDGGPDSITMYMPPLGEIRPFVEKVSKISDKLQLTAKLVRGPKGEFLSHGGLMELRTQTPLFSSALLFRNLATVQRAQGTDHDSSAAPTTGGGALEVQCTLDSRKLLSILDVEKISPSQVLAHFTQAHQVVFNAIASGELSIVFQIPAVST